MCRGKRKVQRPSQDSHGCVTHAQFRRSPIHLHNSPFTTFDPKRPIYDLCIPNILAHKQTSPPVRQLGLDCQRLQLGSCCHFGLVLCPSDSYYVHLTRIMSIWLIQTPTWLEVKGQHLISLKAEGVKKKLITWTWRIIKHKSSWRDVIPTLQRPLYKYRYTNTPPPPPHTHTQKKTTTTMPRDSSSSLFCIWTMAQIMYTQNIQFPFLWLNIFNFSFPDFCRLWYLR